MFKRTLLACVLVSLIMGSSVAEETENEYDEETSPIIQCDQQYNGCAQKCGDSTPDQCIAQCQLTLDRCYNNVLSESDDEDESAESDVE